MKKTILFVLIVSSFLLFYSCSRKYSTAIDKTGNTGTANKATEKQTPEQPENDTVKGVNEKFTKLGFQLPDRELPAINFELKNLQDKSISLESLKGSIVFLNFWATWCPPCRAEVPSMQRLYEKFKDRGLVILGVDLQEDKQKVQDFVKKESLTYPILLDSDGRTGRAYGARSIPTSYIIDKKGFILARTIGGREWDKPGIYELFDALLKK
ncbi:MAG: TlpA family protein disulfide reductase [Spirochaetes bacterium]|nr:TlpA family protein disulfide reductase [Spirochaetota bacterium]